MIIKVTAQKENPVVIEPMAYLLLLSSTEDKLSLLTSKAKSTPNIIMAIISKTLRIKW